MRRLIILIFIGTLIGALSASETRRIDHSQFPQLKGPFNSGPEVTKACLSCHSQSGQDILSTSHWLWKGMAAPIPGHGEEPRQIGKANVINNFCIGVQSNEASCTKCHIGYGWKDKSFDFSNAEKIDCLVCHDTTGEYQRDGDAEFKWLEVAQNVGKTSIQTCGSCHFRGGGGEAVKHGDLDPTLLDADRELDIHMDIKGLGFSCATCHQGESNPHDLLGRSATTGTKIGERLSCQKCHGAEPHGKPYHARMEWEKEASARFRKDNPIKPSPFSERLNAHARKLACQTCHIPEYAKILATKTYWDWSKAGKHDEYGNPVQEIDDMGNITYLSKKGEFKWESNLTPEYRWHNGDYNRYLLGDKMDPSTVTVLNQPLGGPEDPESKIWPFKVMRGNQPYDEKNDMFIQPKLAGDKGSGAYWADYDWTKAAEKGMEYVGLDFSGEVGFARTEMYWPLAHMNVEGSKALSCDQCHSPGGRLKNIPGVYLPGQNHNTILDATGWLSIAFAFMGIGLHAGIRFKNRNRKSNANEKKDA